MSIFDNEGGANNPFTIPYATDAELSGNSDYFYANPYQYATSSELNDPANQGFYKDPYSYATPSELTDPANQGFYGHASQPAAQPNISGIAKLLKSVKKGFKNKISSPEGIAEMLQLAMAARGMFDKGFITPPKGGFQGAVNTSMIANRSQPQQQPYIPYSSQPTMGKNYGVSNVTYAARGGMMGEKSPRYLDGSTDGMADEIDTSIDDTQPAKLSHGEFVIPADVVSHLGNGNSSAGADVLYKMMERVRKARTGNPKQGKQIKPEKFTPGGIASYAGGGPVAFVEGGNVVQEQTLSNWAGPAINDITGRAVALSKQTTPIYQGPLAAGTSPLQTQAFGNLGKLTGSLNDFGTVQSYMNPYINSVMKQQSDEARRQAGITQTGINSQATQAGAFGNSRYGLMSAENNRNLGTTLENIQATGLNRAYDNAMNQQVQAGNYGMGVYGAQLGAGGQQRGIEQQGIDAQRAQFEQQVADPMKRLQFAKDIFSGLPIQTNNTNVNYSSQDNLINQLYQMMPFLKK